ncbi:FAD-dependent oxidoreductase [Sinorhizobium medicae]|uniref:GcvT family protein n=1 Tax=Sinorhizobium medicae TaxID=110321 RepID=UPI000C7D64B7|nr:FAD-dependent oxidoreductase [Sinorhizobium medicae]MDX0998255.1 FAD-dependent oxidoreductase [Sinorhizobium medicae]MDX1102893.1 FAD-dependent oxidoreductase [Sinorhizobium medicae]MDX1152297.1 FAD-dependent oxidoreductase [Sinorhizobium medicae]MDX1183164.1 FAD-dependent oxidoreductase [Sinorhizobium medicae]PLU54689.1 FAD-dependent oxidoreductase [Sinorhizobium medicae]
MPQEFPTQARVVIIGGGIIGCSVAYHLTQLGWTDVVLLEQGQLSGGTTWHAAGLVGQLRSHANMTGVIRYSTQLYSELEAETGLATGWKNCGSLAVARTADRMTVLKRTAASARAQGVAVEVISPREAADLWPVMAVEDLVGAVWLPGDGKANPTDLTQSLAKGARNRGARIIERVRVTGITAKDGTVRGVETDRGSIAAEIVVNCAGQWARKVGLMCGVTVPLHSAEHMYIVTGKIEGVHPDLPVLRDPDGYIYFKEEVGGLVMGGFEPEAKPWGMKGIPDDFEFALLEDDWDQFEVLMQNALIRVPQLETAEVRKFYNGPESFTPDNNFILGEAPELRNFYVGAGFNSMGIASAGGAGRALAEWIVNGAPTMDLWPVDIRRFARFNNNPRWLHDRVKETLGLHYAMPWPNRELHTARPFRRSPLYDRLASRGACFGSKMGWERANWFAEAGQEAETDYAFGRQNWHEAVKREMRATRQAAGIFDQTSFAKLLVQGRDAAKALNRICAADIDVEIGRSIYTGMLNARGGYESDLTVMRLAPDRFFIVTGSAQAVHDADWIRRNIPVDAHVTLTEVTSSYAVLALMGPNARDILGRITSADLSNAGFPFSTICEIDIGYATAFANRMTYVGELGWELIVPSEFAVGVYETLHEAGRDLGLIDCGYYALEALRIEKGFRAWSRELTPDINPYEAGLAFAVFLDKPGGFIGREALVRARQAGSPVKRIVQFTLDDAEPMLWGGELILRDGKPVGEVRSAAYGHTLGRSVALGLIEHDEGVGREFIENGHFEIDLAGDRQSATAHLKCPYDPKSERVRVDAGEPRAAA